MAGMAGMVDAPAPTRARVSALARMARHPLALWGVFGLVHAMLVWLCLTAPGLPLGDVTRVYKLWVVEAQAGAFQVGIDRAWVYPILAFIPMAAAMALGPELYPVTWLGIIVLLDIAAFAVLVGGWRRPPRRRAAAWWWIGLLIALGPIALARIDAVTVPIAIVALLVVARRPALGAALLAIGAWLKIWPAAVVAGLIVASRARLRVIWSALTVTATVLAIGLVLGGGTNMLSFVTQQTGRGLQIESPVSTIWMWQAAMRMPGVRPYYDRDILTYQVAGPGADVASAIMTPLLAIVVAGTMLLGVLAIRRGAAFVAVFPALALAIVTALIAFNKVGSPQFICWLVAPVVLGIVYRRRGFAVPAVLVLAIAALTQLIYPYLYDWLVVADPALVLLLTARNLLELVLFGWALFAVWKSGRRAKE
ncbi:hypothetical protein [Luethyella okanaganae]|uniref:DUF2029 domain-containing protein n=1 Tax=Luethyella okanaganae TaxID=69372 RepID=A0ABW1VDX5_9MICO